MSSSDSVLYVLPGKVGGVVTNLSNLQAAVDRERFVQHTLLTYNDVDRDVRFEGRMSSDTQARFVHRLPMENVYSVLRRFKRALPKGEGVLVASDWLELAAVRRYGTERAVFQILHGDFDYYYELAERHQEDVDVFITCAERVHEKLLARLPARARDAYHIPYGVPLAAAAREPSNGPLRLIYAGRLDRGQKRILDLPRIDVALRSRGVSARWTLVGDGPDAGALRQAWRGDYVRWAGVLPNRETVRLMAEHDVLVLPSQAEGLPLALLEAMGVGLVPVASDLESGIREVVRDHVTGRRVPVGDVDGFASAIEALDRDRARLEAMSAAAREIVRERFSIERQAESYQDLFARWRELRREKLGRTEVPYGSRLDRPWVPNWLVRFVRERTRSDLRTLSVSRFDRAS